MAVDFCGCYSRADEPREIYCGKAGLELVDQAVAAMRAAPDNPTEMTIYGRYPLKYAIQDDQQFYLLRRGKSGNPKGRPQKRISID